MQLIDLYRRESSAKNINDDVLVLPISLMQIKKYNRPRTVPCACEHD
jgi:hypothetical protein